MLAGFAVVFLVASVIIAGGSVRKVAAGPANARRRVVGALLALTSVPVAFAVSAALSRPEAVRDHSRPGAPWPACWSA